jgi:hypothetical protein
MISKLFYLVADPNQLEALKLTEVLDWAALVLNRVDRRSFFDKFQESHAVQYFYEPFLEAFDPELRKELGVWYTPPEIVKYMVERVDTVLRQELGLPLGLADKNVYVLDPCCGTGSYLVEVLDRIHRTLKERGEDALIASDLKEAAQKRVFGFEILPAPFVVSHLQLGLLLQNLGAPLSTVAAVSDRRHGGGDTAATRGPERVGVYLTNALTGWEPPKGPKQHLIFPELEEERDAAEHVKREVPILVILGNPPYNAFAGVSPEEEQGLVEPYKQGLISEWNIKKFNLDDLYVRFFRLAERRIAEKTGRGVVCYISNFSYLGDPSFVIMRQRFLKEFDKLWFDCMNGDSRQTGKLTPEGKPDPSVFSTEYNREGIRVGTAIGLLVRKGDRDQRPAVQFRQFWGVRKRADLLMSLDNKKFDAQYQPAQPDKMNRHSFRPQAAATEYLTWPRLPDLCAVPPAYGHMETRGFALISNDKQVLIERMGNYFDPAVTDDEMRRISPELMAKYCRYDGMRDRARILKKMGFSREHIRLFQFKPFDSRFCYADAQRPLWSEPSSSLSAEAWHGNYFLISRMAGVKDPEGTPLLFATGVFERDVISGHARAIPCHLRAPGLKKRHADQAAFPSEGAPPTANLSDTTRTYLSQLGVDDPDADAEAAGLIWMHALAIGYSPAYLTENADGIRQDWPRIPLPDSRELLLASAEVGKQIAALLDTETPFDVAAILHRHGDVKSPLQKIAAPSRVGGGSLTDEDLAVTAGWGHAGKGGVTMPGKGKIVERDYTESERKPVPDVGARHGVPLLGDRTLDVYLNDVAYWSNIPIRVWEYTIGGYQVIKKWLSYREEKLLGRALSKEEVRYVQEMARRIAAILLLEPALDANYRSVKEHAYKWTT